MEIQEQVILLAVEDQELLEVLAVGLEILDQVQVEQEILLLQVHHKAIQDLQVQEVKLLVVAVELEAVVQQEHKVLNLVLV